MNADERFLKYVTYNTRSSEDSGENPSTSGQWDLAKLLYEELRSMGAHSVEISPYCYVTATIPATAPGPVLGLLAHLDTAPVLSGEGVKPQIITFWGHDFPLDKDEKIILRTADYPDIMNYKGQELIFAGGDTLLGADDKAGIAEIMTAAEYLLQHPEIPHGEIRLCFTPDEEIGQGPNHLDVASFGADFAYTVDGGVLGELEYENFNAAAAQVTIRGNSVHPGEGRGRMKNASTLAMEFHQMLPIFQNPACTDGRQGFYHLVAMKGNEETAELNYIIRDHDQELFQEKLYLLEQAKDFMNSKWGANTVSLIMQEQYRNMVEIVEQYPQLIENAKAAFRSCGIEPKISPIRGGTDGAQLSFMGLPCPNLSTGAHYMHSRYEFIPKNALHIMSGVLINLVQQFVE